MLRLGDHVYVDLPVIRGEGVVTALDVPHPDDGTPGVRVRVGSYPYPVFAAYWQVRRA